MADIERTATTEWQGDLAHGQGTLSTQSGVLQNSPVSFPSRVERAQNTTSPEELLAAAQSSCYAMALSHTLAQAGHPARNLEVKATAGTNRVASGLQVATMQIDVTGDIPGIDEQTFQQLAEKAEQGCPIANAIRGNVQISVNTKLASAAQS